MSAADAYERLVEQALQAYEAGRYAEARNIFRRAHGIQPNARTLRSIGMCSFNLGAYADAVYELEQALSDRRVPLTPEQQAHVRGLIERADAHVGRFRLRLRPAEARLIVDGEAALIVNTSETSEDAANNPSGELLLEPGQHEIEARAPGYLMAHSSVKVAGGDRTTLVFHLMRDEYAVTATGHANVAKDAAAAPAPTSDAGTESSSSWMSTVGYTSLGLGAASLLGFAVTGTLALADENKLQDRCPDELCSEMYRTTVQRYNTMRTLATVTLIAGGALTALGATLLLAQPPAYTGERAKRGRLEPILGFGSVGVRGKL